jgi:predicted RecB family nuclease
MIISDELFESFVKCRTKCYLVNKGFENIPHEYSEWQKILVKDYKKKCFLNLIKDFKKKDYPVSPIFPKEFMNRNIRFAFEPSIQTSDIKSFPHVIECLSVSKRKKFIPIRFSINKKVLKDEKLLLAFDALAMSLVTRETPPFGKIIHGEKFVTLKVQTKIYFESVNEIIDKIKCLIANSSLILKKHCSECIFKKVCFEMAKEKDDLTLLPRMTDKVRKKFHNKGIFTVTQLSYTFRPRKPSKRAKKKIDKFDYALKALAIRDKKIYITGRPKLNPTSTLAYLDIEGIPDKDFYYLIGIRIKENNAISQHSFWANNISEEEKIWLDFYHFLNNLGIPTIIYYGNFEAKFFKRMKLRYPHTIPKIENFDRMISNSINLLKIIYGQIYFPSYSNSLKDICNYFGYRWTEPDASGISSLMWRSKWEVTNDEIFKQKLIKYNSEDCEALEILTNNINLIIQHKEKPKEISEKSNFIHTDCMRRESPYHWGEPLLIPEFRYINKCSYWDYQRDRIYIRSNPFLKKVAKKKSKKRRFPLPINKVIEPSTPSHCPKCRSTPIYRDGRHRKILYDLKISRSGIKRWVEKYQTIHYRCGNCGISFPSDNWFNTKHRYGWGLISFIIYAVIRKAQVAKYSEMGSISHLIFS